MDIAHHPKSRILIRRVLVAKAVRAFGDGFVSLLLPVHLLQLGFTPLQVGVVATATLLGSGVLSLGVGLRAHRYSIRSLLLAAAILMAATGLGFATLTAFWPLLVVAFVGTLNPSSGDVSVFLPLEHALLSEAATAESRTAVFARYSLVGTLSAAVGALAAAVPSLAAATLGCTETAATQAMFVLYGLLGLASGLLYRRLPRHAEGDAPRAHAALGPSRGRVYLLAGLFSVDAFAGGLVVQSMLALWLLQRFAMPLGTIAALFAWSGLLSAGSFLVAVRIARRIGLVNTMVFTHIPSSVCLVLLPFAPDVASAVALLLVRSALSQMDVPTRSSYVMAIVTPAERPAAASVTSVPRSLAAAASPVLAGWMLAASPFGWPLVAAGALKIAYDLALLAAFRAIRPPEEGRRPGDG